MSDPLEYCSSCGVHFDEHDNLVQLCAELQTVQAERKDLAMLVVRLSRRAPFGDKVVDQAMDYLKRKGLLGSIIREVAAMRSEPTTEKGT